VFVACLPYSDYCFALAVPSQKLEDFIYALGCCLKDLGGVPQTLVPDNLKSAVIKANPYEPELNRALEDFANHYGTSVTPARPRKPQDKGLVENQVKLIYSRVYAKLRKLTFFDLPSLNKAIAQKVREHNQTRMQQKDYCREEKFDLIFPQLKSIDFRDSEEVTRRTQSITRNLNRRLKIAAKQLGIKKNISMHIARHSFGNISGDKIPIQMLQKLYRHSSVTTTIRYQANFIHKDADDALDSVVNF